MSLISSLIPSLGAAPAIQPAAKDATPATDLGPTVTPRYQLNETAEAYPPLPHPQSLHHC